jgi:hypothetical protein
MAFPIAACGLLYYLGFLLGLLLLVVPGIFVATAWAVSMPALVHEQIGPFKAFARSRDLTRGHPFVIVGCVLLVIVPTAVLNYAASKLIRGLGLPVTLTVPLVGQLLLPLTTAFEQVILGGVLASLYVELVTLRQGGFGSNLADAFD